MVEQESVVTLTEVAAVAFYVRPLPVGGRVKRVAPSGGMALEEHIHHARCVGREDARCRRPIDPAFDQDPTYLAAYLRGVSLPSALG